MLSTVASSLVLAEDRFPRQLNFQDFPQSESDDRTRISSLIAFASSLPEKEDLGSGGDMWVDCNASCDANDASTMPNAMNTDQGNLVLSWSLAIQCILVL